MPYLAIILLIIITAIITWYPLPRWIKLSSISLSIILIILLIAAIVS
ncbi:hypothetical protein [Lacticaseibacillus brantae]|nr:hypothetical protein [Lacticaseibacillus brantae]